jgi:5-methyltetrahydropteroyltriglutamate--homocysteine methyltransferase
LKPYPKYTTTVIGAYSVPDWYEPLDRLMSVGQLSMTAMADAQYRASEAAIHDQERAGIDIITGGEMHRRTHNRHSPPNAMLNYFWQKIPAFQGATQPKPITPYDPNVFHPAATCRARIQDNLDLGLAEEFKAVSSLTDKPVKITMTGPHMLAKVAYDEHYGDIAEMMSDLGKLLRYNFQILVDAGCKHIQIDEPLFTMAEDAEVRAAVDTINMAIKGLPADVHTSTHVCQGNYAVGKEYDAQIGHRYFDSGRYKADLVCKIGTDSYLIERHDASLRRAFGKPPARRRCGRRAGPRCGKRRDRRRPHRQVQMARAGTDDHHQLLRLQPPAAQHRRRQAARDDRSQANSRW